MCYEEEKPGGENESAIDGHVRLSCRTCSADKIHTIAIFSRFLTWVVTLYLLWTLGSEIVLVIPSVRGNVCSLLPLMVSGTDNLRLSFDNLSSFNIGLLS